MDIFVIVTAGFISPVEFSCSFCDDVWIIREDFWRYKKREAFLICFGALFYRPKLDAFIAFKLLLYGIICSDVFWWGDTGNCLLLVLLFMQYFRNMSLMKMNANVKLSRYENVSSNFYIADFFILKVITIKKLSKLLFSVKMIFYVMTIYFMIFM